MSAAHRQTVTQTIEVAAGDAGAAHPSAAHQAKLRQKHIESCQGLVRSLAWKIHRKLPSRVDLDDLIAYGELGLAQAAHDFDETRGNKFTTYAHYRIRGAIFDGLAKMSWFSRQDYHGSRYEQMTHDLLQVDAQENEDGAHASLADDVRWFGDLSGSLAVAYIASQQEDRWSGGQFGIAASEPSVALSLRELRQKLWEVIEELPDEAATLIRATYVDGLTLQEAGDRLGISKAWASRLHAKTLKRLADSLRRAGVAD